MEIEKEQKVMLRDVSNSSFSYKMKEEKETPSSLLRKKEDKMCFFDSARK